MFFLSIFIKDKTKSEILLIVSISFVYIPVIKAIVPPDTPGIISAIPIRNPRIIIKKASSVFFILNKYV